MHGGQTARRLEHPQSTQERGLTIEALAHQAHVNAAWLGCRKGPPSGWPSRLRLAGHEVVFLTLTVKDTGMEDYRLDQRVDPTHHPAAVKRMTESKRTGT